MIEIKNLVKRYGQDIILENINCQLKMGKIYGLIGYNGVGKTTLLKSMAGIYNIEKGEILCDDNNIWENIDYKKQIFIMTEDFYWPAQANLQGASKFYKGYYANWQTKVYEDLINILKLDPKAKISSFSKGMQRQAGLIIALATKSKYLFLDETFDGLDENKRLLMKAILEEYIKKTQALVIITSHYWQELSETVDYIGLIENKQLNMLVNNAENLKKLNQKQEVDIDDLQKLFT